MRWNQKQRFLLADKLADSANVILATMVVGSIIGERYQFGMLIGGLSLYLMLLGLSLRFKKEEKGEYE